MAGSDRTPDAYRTTINSVKVTFDLQTREADVAKNVPVNVLVNVPVKLTETQRKVFDLIKENPTITHLEISKKLSINEKTAKRATQALRKLDVIKREGSDNQATGY